MTKVATIGLDLSLTSTGVSVDGVTSSIRMTSRGVRRLMEIRDEIMGIVSQRGIDCAAIEHYSYASRNSQAHSIGELGGVVRLALYDARVPFVEIPPTCRAKFATGKGNARKLEVVSAISAVTGVAWTGGDRSDRCDAWVLEEMLRYHLGASERIWAKANTDALKKVDWSPLADIEKEAQRCPPLTQ